MNKNIQLRKNINVNYFVSDEEKLLFQTIQKIKPVFNEKIRLRSYDDAFETLLTLHLPLDNFFENVMVMTDDELVRSNRLALIHELQELFLKVADISLMNS